MSRAPMYTMRLTERGDLVRMEVAPSGHVEMPVEKNLKKDDVIAPHRPNFPSPPPPTDETTAFPLSPSKKTPSVTIPTAQTNGHISTMDKNKNKPAAPHPPLKLYADRDVRALEKNPMHGDIMNAAEQFKGRRDLYSVDDDLNSMQRGEPVSDYKKVTEYSKQNNGVKHPVYDTDEMKRKKEHPLVVNSEMRWSEPKPLVKRNTYTVIPNSQLPSHLANAQNSQKPQPRRAASVAEGLGYARVQDVPEVDALLDMMATHDEKGHAIPEWRRKLMARNYRVKLCSQLKS